MTLKIGDKFYSNKPKSSGTIEIIDIGTKFAIVQTERGKKYKYTPTVRKIENLKEMEKV